MAVPRATVGLLDAALLALCGILGAHAGNGAEVPKVRQTFRDGFHVALEHGHPQPFDLEAMLAQNGIRCKQSANLVIAVDLENHPVGLWFQWCNSTQSAFKEALPDGRRGFGYYPPEQSDPLFQLLS